MYTHTGTPHVLHNQTHKTPTRGISSPHMPHMYCTHSPHHTPAHHTHVTTPPHYIPHTSYTNTHALHKHPHISHTPHTPVHTPPHVPHCILVHTAHPLHTSYAHTNTRAPTPHPHTMHKYIHTTHTIPAQHIHAYTHTCARVRCSVTWCSGPGPTWSLSAQTCFLPALSVLSLGSSFQVPWPEVPSAVVKISRTGMPHARLDIAFPPQETLCRHPVSRACFLPSSLGMSPSPESSLSHRHRDQAGFPPALHLRAFCSGKMGTWLLLSEHGCQGNTRLPWSSSKRGRIFCSSWGSVTIRTGDTATVEGTPTA